MVPAASNPKTEGSGTGCNTRKAGLTNPVANVLRVPLGVYS